jgi:hypothetical protein
MQPKRLILLSFFVLVCFLAKAQVQDEYSGPLLKQPSYSVPEPTHQKKVFSHKQAKAIKYKRVKVTHTPEYEFYKRIEAAAKEHQKNLKKLYKPQFSDFSYYGHKRKPKMHAPDKMRYCGECGIRH